MLARFAVRRVAGASCLFFFSSSAPARLQKLWIPERALEFTAGKASGPGGQNINKSLSKIEVRFHIGSATWIDENTKERLREQNRNRVNQLDEIFLYCERHRTPLENRREAMAILQRIVDKARRTPPADAEARVRRAGGRRRKEWRRSATAPRSRSSGRQ
eukprot:TRINITY_DN6640_c0_g2_i3.p1 TRINITY_DN6640_c0_g2~~TRINITY_DN6640_c0_g2_i3.p1  ORF type:complete len:160 (-),score=20.87 TRINITY_DN6640_c0_g2_i3:151-630(-)